MTQPLLRVENLTVEFDTPSGPARAVDSLSFEIHPGETLGLVGESGCGKSVTALSLLRLHSSPPARYPSGRVLFRGEDLWQAAPARLRAVRGGSIGFVFQEPMTALSPLHRIGDQLVEAGLLHGMARPDAEAAARRWLARVGLVPVAERMRAWPHELSGGMRQRAMIAMALLPEPDLIVADEPTTALDVTVQAQIFDLLLHARPEGTALLLITHDMALAWQVCDRLLVMYASRLAESAPREPLFAAPAHPYTRGLLDAVPSLDPAPGAKRLVPIPGTLPAPAERIPGCRFAPRCPRASEACRRDPPPPLRPLAPGRLVACHHPLA